MLCFNLTEYLENLVADKHDYLRMENGCTADTVLPSSYRDASPDTCEYTYVVGMSKSDFPPLDESRAAKKSDFPRPWYEKPVRILTVGLERFETGRDKDVNWSHYCRDEIRERCGLDAHGYCDKHQKMDLSLIHI